MSDFDHSDLDGHLLQLLLAVVEEGSITRAGQRLGVTQSAVSHGLDKLRAIVGDPLFVKSGRGIVATAHAQALAGRARVLLDELRAFAAAGAFEPAAFTGTVTIAANELQRDLLLPRFLARVRQRAPALVLRVIPSGAPGPELLREEHCQLLVTPRPPEAGDIVQKRLFEDRYRVFYDAAARPPPRDLADYLAAEHVSVLYHPRRRLDIDEVLAARGVARRFAVLVPGFSGVAAFLRGSPWLATLPSRLGRSLLQGLASVEPPLDCPPLPMYLAWHLRHQHDPMQRWLREELQAVVAPSLAGA